jgi:hypothetical protein
MARRHFILRGIVLAAGLIFLSLPGAHAQQPDPLVVHGDWGPFYALLDKARRGETITIVGLGGSITACAGASSPQHCWLNRTAAWFTEKYGVPVNLINAGVGGTNSVYGALRFQTDVADKKPDWVIVDFAVNDAPEDAHALESITRRALSLSLPVSYLMLSDQAGEGRQDDQVPIARHYDVPAISYRDPMEWLIGQGRIDRAQLSVDGVHPTDLGHAHAGSFVRAFLDAVQAQFPAAAEIGRDVRSVLPAPIHGSRMERVVYKAARALDVAVASRRGFAFFPDMGAGLLVGFQRGEEVRIPAQMAEGGCVWLVKFVQPAAMHWGTVAVFVDPAQDLPAQSYGTLFGVFPSSDAKTSSGGVIRAHETCRISPGRRTLQLVDWLSEDRDSNHQVWIIGVGWSGTEN